MRVLRIRRERRKHARWWDVVLMERSWPHEVRAFIDVADTDGADGAVIT
jgi:hypothetical protein